MDMKMLPVQSLNDHYDEVMYRPTNKGCSKADQSSIHKRQPWFRMAELRIKNDGTQGDGVDWAVIGRV
jgi:hypothetical protein